MLKMTGYPALIFLNTLRSNSKLAAALRTSDCFWLWSRCCKETETEAAYEPPEHAPPSSPLSVLPILIQNQPYVLHLHSRPPFTFTVQIFKDRSNTHFIEFFNALAFSLPDPSSSVLICRVHSWQHHDEYARLSLSLGLTLSEWGVYSWENVVHEMHFSLCLLYKKPYDHLWAG